MPENFVQMVSDLGGTLGSLIACFWYIKYQSDQFSKREERWITKDDTNDQALRDLMTTSHSQLLTVLTGVNTTLKEMTVAISELKQTIEHGERR
jgi:hypothetical protein